MHRSYKFPETVVSPPPTVTETTISMEKDKSTDGETPVYVDVSGSNEVINEKVEHVGHHHEALDSKAANITAYQVEPVQGESHSLKDELLQDEELDLFKPFPIDDSHPVEEHILTIRSLVTGICLGALVNASNLYLGRHIIHRPHSRRIP